MAIDTPHPNTGGDFFRFNIGHNCHTKHNGGIRA